VAGDWNQIQEAKKSPKVSKQVARLRLGPLGVRSKAISGMKTLRNFYAIAKVSMKTDPTFLPFAESLLEEYGIERTAPQEITSKYCTGWRPPLKYRSPN
jgi:hypothetical protein